MSPTEIVAPLKINNRAHRIVSGLFMCLSFFIIYVRVNVKINISHTISRCQPDKTGDILSFFHSNKTKKDANAVHVLTYACTARAG